MSSSMRGPITILPRKYISSSTTKGTMTDSLTKYIISSDSNGMIKTKETVVSSTSDTNDALFSRLGPHVTTIKRLIIRDGTKGDGLLPRPPISDRYPCKLHHICV